MAYETSVQQGQTNPAGIIILIASQAKLTALSPYSFWLSHRLKPAILTPHPSSAFHGSGLFVPTLYLHEVLLCHCWCKQLVSFYDGCIIICCYCAIYNTFDCLLLTAEICPHKHSIKNTSARSDDKASWHKIQVLEYSRPYLNNTFSQMLYSLISGFLTTTHKWNLNQCFAEKPLSRPGSYYTLQDYKITASTEVSYSLIHMAIRLTEER